VLIAELAERILKIFAKVLRKKLIAPRKNNVLFGINADDSQMAHMPRPT
jgi:hypothetical protein